MLAFSTLAFLADLQEKSDSAYSEGGLLYTYIEAANQAHSRYKASDKKTDVFSPEDLQELACFIQSSQGNYQLENAEPSYLSTAQQLLELLQVDLKFNETTWFLERGGYDMRALITMVRHIDNRFFSLEFMWSVD
jgi:hypothetical protein